MPRSPARQRATGRVTLADVALAAGVSPITVSRALRGERAVDPVLVERVQAAAQKLGYVPDPARTSNKDGYTPDAARAGDKFDPYTQGANQSTSSALTDSKSTTKKSSKSHKKAPAAPTAATQ